MPITYDFYMYSAFGHRMVVSCTLLSGCRRRYRNVLIIIIRMKPSYRVPIHHLANEYPVPPEYMENPYGI